MKVLGELEAAIMNVLWDKKQEHSVRQVHDKIKKSHSVAYTTVMTVMTRLTEKELLTRRLESGAYWYEPTVGCRDFFSRLSSSFVDSIRKEFGDPAAEAFIDEVQLRKNE